MSQLIFEPYGRTYFRAFQYNKFKQNGLCRFCERPIEFGEPIVRKGKKRIKYYHANCAKKALII